MALTRIEVDVTTGQTTVIPLTHEEIADAEARTAAEIAAREARTAAEIAAREAAKPTLESLQAQLVDLQAQIAAFAALAESPP